MTDINIEMVTVEIAMPQFVLDAIDLHAEKAYGPVAKALAVLQAENGMNDWAALAARRGAFLAGVCCSAGVLNFDNIAYALGVDP